MSHDTTPETLAATVARANDLEHWKKLERETHAAGMQLNGWAHGTLWLSGTPAPLLGFKMRGQEFLRVSFTQDSEIKKALYGN